MIRSIGAPRRDAARAANWPMGSGMVRKGGRELRHPEVTRTDRQMLGALLGQAPQKLDEFLSLASSDSPNNSRLSISSLREL